MTNPKMPDGNNVYGRINVPQGLTSVLRALTPLVGEKRAYIYTSQFNQAQTLYVSTDTVVFESAPLADATRHLLNGSVGGTQDDVAAFVLSLSGLFTKAGIEHRFEVDDADDNLVQQIP